jgi:hypothetical protein
MPRRSRKSISIEGCIKNFLKRYRGYSHLHERYGGIYYWNERDVQWALLSNLKRSAPQVGIGSEWRVHAEGDIKRPRYVRTEGWPGTRRADIVVIDHAAFKRAWRTGANFPPYDAMIEIKLMWPHTGRKAYAKAIEKDASKLKQCLSRKITKNAFLVLLDAVDRNGLPYFQKEQLKELKKGSSLLVYHWPDSEVEIKEIGKADFRKY